MSSIAPSLLKTLPPEIINLVLREIEDGSFLWVVCRQVSREIRAEVEFMFQSAQLRKASVYWPGNDHPTPAQGNAFEFHFSRISEDGASVYLKIDLAQEVEVEATSAGLEVDARPFAWRNFELVFQEYLHNKAVGLATGGKWEWRGPVTRIGLHRDTDYMTDMPLPTVGMHSDTMEISMDWKELFGSIFWEEHGIEKHGIEKLGGC
ncbi:hypothetical protein EJ07DRAFT_179800 [Lizonia empirigonia]|nr:hypothetical protein EJ07DRAFT_179800 [Lizonia empirigonia]